MKNFDRLIAETHALVNFYRAQVLHEEPWEFGRTKRQAQMMGDYTQHTRDLEKSIWKLHPGRGR